ncbi:MAG: hypothetical protein Q7J07_06480 [Pelolinea sp.]|nr:hypothetical protein [Pelolinea sp.]
MVSVNKYIRFENKSEKKIFEGAILAVPQAGLKVWETRGLARPVLAHGEVGGQEVHCNIIVSMVDKSTTMNAESDGLDENALNVALVRLEDALKAQLT